MVRKNEEIVLFLGPGTIESLAIKDDVIEGHILAKHKGMGSRWFTLSNIHEDCFGPSVVVKVNGIKSNKQVQIFFQDTDGNKYLPPTNNKILAEKNSFKAEVSQLKLEIAMMTKIIKDLGGEARLTERAKKMFSDTKDIKSEGQFNENYNNGGMGFMNRGI